jgi:hypothetical protein
MSEGDCSVCKELLDQAAGSIRTHLHALTRLDQAVQAGQANVSALEKSVRISSEIREEAVARYKDHNAGHDAKVSAGGSG